MSPRNFWNHPLQEIARSLARTFGPDQPGTLTTDEFVALLGRLVGSTAQGPGFSAQLARRRDQLAGRGPIHRP